MNGLDSPCNIYRCEDGVWYSPLEFELTSCGHTNVQVPEDGLLCSNQCLADMDSATFTLDVLCQFRFEQSDPDVPVPEPGWISECSMADGDWQLGPDEELCIGVVVDRSSEAQPMAFPAPCAEAGVNAAFVVVGNFPDDVELSYQCQRELFPETPCPDFEFLTSTEYVPNQCEA